MLKKNILALSLFFAIIFSSLAFSQYASAAAINGWYQSNSNWYYYQNGTKATSSWKSDSHGWCYLGSDGAWVKNYWVQDSRGWCYISADGYWMNHSGYAKDSLGYCIIGNDGYWTGERLSSDPSDPGTPESETIKISYIDTGQADSILIQQGSYSMLIDAGNNEDSDTVKDYINREGITQLDYVIGTHPHEDHIGGLEDVINSFDIGRIYLPEVTTNTQAFEDVISAVRNKNLTITAPEARDSFKLGKADCTILGPIHSNEDDLNTYSIVLKATLGNRSFLFTGDAQISNEKDMIDAGYDLSADVLKVGHHGSSTSTSQEFLNEVKPTYAVISVGRDNPYGLTADEVISRLKNEVIDIFRTDVNGTVICTSDGNNITFNSSPAISSAATTPAAVTGWLKKDGSWYYYQDDGTLATGWIIWQGKYYYLHSSGAMAVNTITPDGYKVGPDGAWNGKDSTSQYYEDAVNSYNCSSSTGYYIYVNLTSHVLCILTGSRYNWTIKYVFPCTVGTPETPTITGMYTVRAKGLYFITDNDLICKYYTQIYGNYLMHSILYYPDGRIADARLGMNLSHGCIRLATENAKYIYDNIPAGTGIWIVQ
ncbi:MAG: MBL fold metallo-hydrolase [Clostridiaceae bacterium]